jgi:hypothetical protein
MVGAVGIIALLTALFLSLLVTRLATAALTMTGLSREAARFQARSAFTGTGFTTHEAEKVVDHPVRRRVIMLLMIVRSAGFITIIISLIISFVGTSAEGARLGRLLWLVAGVIVLWFFANNRYVERYLNRLIQWALTRWTDLDTRDYAKLLRLSGDYGVNEIYIRGEDWLAGKQLKDCRLRDEGVTVLGVYRKDGRYIGAPVAGTRIEPDDTLILYGRTDALQRLDERRRDQRGEQEHEQAVAEQRRVEEEQAKEDAPSAAQ